MQLWLAQPNEGICLHVQYKHAALQPPNRLQGRTNTQAVLVPVIMLSLFLFTVCPVFFCLCYIFMLLFCCLYFSVLLFG